MTKVQNSLHKNLVDELNVMNTVVPDCAAPVLYICLSQEFSIVNSPEIRMENCDLLPIIFDIVVGLLFPSKKNSNFNIFLNHFVIHSKYIELFAERDDDSYDEASEMS